MVYRSPVQKRANALRVYRLVMALGLAFLLVSLLDGWILAQLVTLEDGTRTVDRTIAHNDWYALLRVMGSLWTWTLLALVTLALGWRLRRCVALWSAAALSGIAAELLKLVFARERPVVGSELIEGGYRFRAPFSGFVDGSNLGLPSSHTAVAFGGCVALALFERRLLVLAPLLALGCGVTRIMTGAHYPSDVFVGAVLGVVLARWVVSIQPDQRPRFTLGL